MWFVPFHILCQPADNRSHSNSLSRVQITPMDDTISASLRRLRPSNETPLPELCFATDNAAELARLGGLLRTFLSDTAATGPAVRLFGGHAQQIEALQRSGAGTIVDAYEKFGLGRQEDGRLIPGFQAQMIDGFVLYSDLHMLPRDIRRSNMRDAYVDPLWEGPVISSLLPGEPCERALDMGCGCGVLALTLTRASKHVIATDVNPRALQLTEFNALLNGVTNLEVRHSDLFSALRNDRFDRVVFNAPVGLEFKPANLLEAGEGILHAFFAQLHDHLTDDGMCWVNICTKDYGRSRFFDRFRDNRPAGSGKFRMLFLEQWRMEKGLKFRARQLAARLFHPGYGSLLHIRRGILCLQRSETGPAYEYRTPYFRWTRALGSEFGSRFVEWAIGQGPETARAAAPDSLLFLPAPDAPHRELALQIVQGYGAQAQPIYPVSE